MSNVTYAGYGRKAGFIPMKEKMDEFEQLSEQLFDVNAKLRYHAFYDPEGIYDQLVAQKQHILQGLEVISKPKRKAKVSNL